MFRKFIIFFISFCQFVSAQELKPKDTILVRLTNNLENSKHDSLKIKALIELGEYQITRDFSEAEPLLLEALKIAERYSKNQTENLASVYGLIGIVYKRTADYPKAIDYYLKSKSLYEKLQDTSNIANVYHNIAMLHRDQKDYSKSVRYFKKAIAFKRQVKDIQGEAIAYNMLGVTYRYISVKDKKQDSAIVCYNIAKKLFFSINDSLNMYRVNSNLAALYHNRKNFKEALKIYKTNLAYYTRVGNKSSLFSTYHKMAYCFLKFKEYKTAIQYEEKALTIAKEEGFKSRESKAYLRISFIYAKWEKYKEAHNNYRAYKKKSDAIFNIDNAKKIQALELRHEFDKERLELELITKNEKAKNKLYLALFLGVLIAGIVISFLIRKIYRNKVLITSQELEKNKEELENYIKQLLQKSQEQEILKQQLEQIESQKSEQKSLKAFQELINSKILTKDDWYFFKEKFTSVYPTFFNHIKSQGYQLTKSEERLVALEKLELNNEEIANILGVSLRTIIMSRYRLRKKINAPKDISLIKYFGS